VRVLVTGGRGMIGSAVARTAPDGVETVCCGRGDGDLADPRQCDALFERTRPTHVIHLAARVGGVLDNTRHPADFFRENVLINTHVLDAARRVGVVKVISLLSSCIYPDGAPLPLREPSLHAGEPHPSNFAYAYAKRMLEVQSRACAAQYGSTFVCLIPNNVYGPHDNFDLESGHVIPAIIRKVHAARQGGPPAVLWGDGSPRREFTFSSDIGRAVWWALREYHGPPLNVGTDEEISIRDAAAIICRELGCDPGRIEWDASRPAGQPRKPTDTRRFRELSGLRPTPFAVGAAETVRWYLANYPNVRGVGA
jgi:GDP-L-fucose synthase